MSNKKDAPEKKGNPHPEKKGSLIIRGADNVLASPGETTAQKPAAKKPMAEEKKEKGDTK